MSLNESPCEKVFVNHSQGNKGEGRSMRETRQRYKVGADVREKHT